MDHVKATMISFTRVSLINRMIFLDHFYLLRFSRDFESSFTSSFRRKNFISAVRESTDIISSSRRFCHLAWSRKWAKKKFEVNFKRLLMSVLLWIASTIDNMLAHWGSRGCWDFLRKDETPGLVAGSDDKTIFEISFIR